MKLQLVVVVVLVSVATARAEESQESCFCELKGDIDDCSCNVESVDSFNNDKIQPILQDLLKKDFFRYFKVNLNKVCPFWPDQDRCSLRDCRVKQCSVVPDALKGSSKPTNHNHERNKYSEEAQKQDDDCDKQLDQLDKTISDESKEQFVSWQKHDDAKNNFCELDDEDSVDMDYVDLLKNPERYTGYIGSSPARIWYSIYNENCFKPQPGYSYQEAMRGLCLEKRAFYRMISGLHTSINVHLCANNPIERNPFGVTRWGPNLAEFQRRFDPELTKGEGSQRLKNLYFAYLVELKAIVKAAPYLEKEIFFSGGGSAVDKDVQASVKLLLDTIKAFPHHFDESRLFKDVTLENIKIKEEFRNHFYNISRIMDCVGCDKCKLWGKLQTQGMGTAFKILFSPEITSTQKVNQPQFQLQRHEIVALFNAFGRLSNSIKAVDGFRKMLS